MLWAACRDRGGDGGEVQHLVVVPVERQGIFVGLEATDQRIDRIVILAKIASIWPWILNVWLRASSVSELNPAQPRWESLLE